MREIWGRKKEAPSGQPGVLIYLNTAPGEIVREQLSKNIEGVTFAPSSLRFDPLTLPFKRQEVLDQLKPYRHAALIIDRTTDDAVDAVEMFALLSEALPHVSVVSIGRNVRGGEITGEPFVTMTTRYK